MEITQALSDKFGAHRIEIKPNPLHPSQTICFIYLELSVPLTIITTVGLSEYIMPVLDKWKGREHNELFFALPTYWDLEDINNPNFSWVYDWLFRLETFVREKNTWYGPGHTIPTANPPVTISNLMKQEYFIFLDPIFTAETLQPIQLSNKTVYFLAIVPIFGDELDYKMGKGTQKFVKRLQQRNMDERIDDYRHTALRSRLRFYRS